MSMKKWMFPVCAGMNRTRSSFSSERSYVPRVCGDEPPPQPANPFGVPCSPCVRG